MRRPEPTPPERIETLATLPVFFRLGRRKALIAGASPAALWKAELLAAAGADLTVCAGADAAPVADLAMRLARRGEAGYGGITALARGWTPADLAGVALAVGDFGDAAEAGAFFDAARAAGVPVNVIDKPDFCDFQFGAIVNRSPLVVAISTDGAAPVFGQAIRARIEAILPRGLSRWAKAARDWRPAVQARGLAYAARRRFWEVFAARALRDPDAPPGAADRAACFAGVDDASTGRGRIVLVGAGPGDPGLVTLKAVQALQGADVMLYDDLVTPEVLDLARREATRIAVGKTGHGASCAQEEITLLMVRLAREGRRVVRLKGGDPMIFGRASEEIDAARAAGIPVEVVPGVSTAQAAAAALGVSLTERSVARRLQFVTGHDATGALPDDVDWAALADPGASTAVYMPRRSLEELVGRLIAHGLPPMTPAIAIASVSRPEQAHVAVPVADLPRQADALASGPLLVLIGRAFGRQAPQACAAAA